MVTEEQNPEEKQQTEEVVRRMNGKGDLDLSNPEAIILDALGLARYQDVVKNRSGVMKRLDLFGGPIDGGAWDAIQEYIGTGSKGRLSPKEEHYLDLLNLVFSLDGQYGKRNTIKFLTSPYFGLGYEAANNLWSEAIEMFYANRKVSKDALRAKTADQLDQVYVAALNAAKTTKDFKQAAEILAMKAQVLGLDKEDAQLLQRQVYMEAIVISSSMCVRVHRAPEGRPTRAEGDHRRRPRLRRSGDRTQAHRDGGRHHRFRDSRIPGE